MLNKSIKPVQSKLNFGLGNAKLSKAIATFSLPAGFSCIGAKDCLSKADRNTGKLTDSKTCKFRCFAASQECAYPSVRNARWSNFEMLKKASSIELMGKLIQKSLPYGLNIVRVHVSGDFFNEKYFLAWLNVAMNNPLVVFYGYTKATPFLVKYADYIPTNFRFTASKGGTHDDLIEQHDLKYAEVVYSKDEAHEKNLLIDHDDSLAFNSNKSFALLLHGMQPANTPANKAWNALRKQGIGGYGKSSISRKVVFERKMKVYVSLRNGKVFIPSCNDKPLIKKVIYAEI